jgi:type VI secretion system secreted protein VgrG
MDDSVSALLSAFASAFNQDSRLFTLHFADNTLEGQLLPYTLNGEETLSTSYRFDLVCLSSDIFIELKTLVGQAVDIAIGLADGGERLLSGVVTQAKQLGADGGFARYGLIVEPAFATLSLRRNSRVFQDKSVVAIIGLVLDEHIQTNPAFAQCFRHRDQLTASYPNRSYCQQYRESDLAFIERLLREEGISYYFDFNHGGEEIGLHTLVLFDAGSELSAAPHHAIRFHRADAIEDEDSITDWRATRHIQSSGVQLASFDYKGVYTQQGTDTSAIDHGDAGSGLTSSLEDYDPQTLYYASDSSDISRYATLRQQAHDLNAKTFSGTGVVRGIGIGQWFTLNDHPIHDQDSEADRQFVVIQHNFAARNNLPGEFESVVSAKTVSTLTNAANDSLDLTAPGYQNRFTVVRKAIPIVPAYSHSDSHKRYAKPTAPGAQTATVVGPAGEEIYTDELGRIKIQFHWARVQDHDQSRHGASADNNDFSSCWVRMAYPSAGANWGHQFIPRVGQEVLVEFIEGDIDRPVVIGALYSGQQTPPAFSGKGSLPANKTLSGIKSQEHKGTRYNELVLDDSTHEIRITLSSDHGKSQLNQGFLIHPRTEGKGEPRGEGFELRTDNAGALRAAQGLLITTEAQTNAAGNQLQRTSAQALLDSATLLADQLGDTAKKQTANQPETGKANQTINAKPAPAKPAATFTNSKKPAPTLSAKATPTKTAKAVKAIKPANNRSC